LWTGGALSTRRRISVSKGYELRLTHEQVRQACGASLLLDEFERVGLLRRAKDEDGRIWGYWVGSDKFGPTMATIKQARYKTGRLDLFFPQEQLAATCKTEEQLAATCNNLLQLQGLGLGVGVGFGEGKGLGVDLDAARSSENERKQVKPDKSKPSISKPETVEPKATAKPDRKRPVLSSTEYMRNQTDKSVIDFATEIAGRERCPVCGAPHPLPFCTPPPAKS
jgi:hypothetical protein